MKFKGLKGLVVGGLVLCFVLTGTTFAADKLGILKNEYSGIQTEEEIMEKIASKTFDELLSEINILGDSAGTDSMLYHANALKEKATNISSDKIQFEILNDSNSINARVILIQISKLIDTPLDVKVLQNMISDNEVDFEIKRNVLLYLYKSSDMALIEKVSLGDDDKLAFQAIKMLNKVDPNQAIEISDDIIRNYNGIVNEKVRAAIKVKANQLANNSTVDERMAFIDFCDGILITSNNDKKKDDIVSDTVIFSLSDVMSKETISYIVASDKIDRIAKSYSIDQNYTVLRSMLTDDTSEENLNTVIEAMYICPIKDMEEPLKKATSAQLQQNSAKSGQEAEKLQEVLNLIEESGIAATGKY